MMMERERKGDLSLCNVCGGEDKGEGLREGEDLGRSNVYICVFVREREREREGREGLKEDM